VALLFCERRPRQVLFRAMREDLGRSHVPAEKDRRNQQAQAAELRLALARAA
jgi:hypothetical protein